MERTHSDSGTAVCFAGDEGVFTFSMHEGDIYPVPKATSDLDIEQAVRIASAALTVGEEEFARAEALMRDGKTEQARRAFEALIARYARTWIEYASRKRLARIEAAK